MPAKILLFVRTVGGTGRVLKFYGFHIAQKVTVLRVSSLRTSFVTISCTRHSLYQHSYALICIVVQVSIHLDSLMAASTLLTGSSQAPSKLIREVGSKETKGWLKGDFFLV